MSTSRSLSWPALPGPLPAVLLGALLGALLAAGARAQNCSATSTGRTPLSELGAGSYQGYTGGLYGNGSNDPPAAHGQQGLQRANAVQPLDAAGNPSPAGRIVLLSIGMSNTTQEFSRFVELSDSDPTRSGDVVVVDGAQGGQHAGIVRDPTARFWSVVESRLQQNGVTAQQVQVVWLKEALPGPTGGFPAHAQQLSADLAQIARNLQAKYPNVQLCFLSSRIYAGYATTALNPEPYAYESAFAVRWTIEQQIAGDPGLNHDPALGPVAAPWLGWGPYLWADGLVPRGDGLVWTCADFQSDGTHPSPSGRQKVAEMLLRFCQQDARAAPWYLGPNDRAGFGLYGEGCAGTAGVPRIDAAGVPTLGNATFRIQLGDTVAGRAALLVLGAAPGAVPVAPPCELLVDPSTAFPTGLSFTNAQGRAAWPLPVPNDAALIGLLFRTQWLVDDPAGAPLPPLLGLAATRGGWLRVGLP